ncbi:non-ribosomal peptide synthetase/type I polyketide synthase [Paenibacillus arenosi]|uniref:Amino acid adenylation domain-containing protein n=1 Tax=Paenibacillus arenosi TaxID=2774142 RepID=A0ABR9AZ47_9BACL|nr:non-ribosomal peptide synthetase/type I polyketide synthase [Paenibacillus arenosi]MBD8499353.1 amino acid adenylation domain-containing protein [Paenibacillus arenosi]
MSESASKSSIIKQALLEIKRLKQELQAKQGYQHEPIAIVGMACHFPGGITSPQQYWDALVEMKDMIQPIPETRWNTFREKNSTLSPFLHKAGFLTEDIEAFDHRLFRFSPKEAERTDPQHRLFLKVCWEALENAGYAPDSLRGSLTGVYAGVTLPDYIQQAHAHSKQNAVLEPNDVTGKGFSFLSGRASYYFGFQGPGITVDTACSASLVSVDQACKGLLTGDCELALAGGVNLMYSPETTELLATLNILSPNCELRSFDAHANGTVRGEGCGVVVLKKLSAAERDGDYIHAIIQGSGVNQDGLSSGMTAPYGPAQEQLLSNVWARCGIESRDIGYIEAHGTGTELGDPIEMSALGNVIGKDRSHPLYVGTVKSSIGHLEAAAGIAGLIKVILAVENGKIPGNARFATPSPHIDWEQLPVQVPRETTLWEPDSKPRIAGVSSFGLSGTNAHVVVAQYNKQHLYEKSDHITGGHSYDEEKAWPFKFSSVSQKGLRNQLESFLAFLEHNDRAGDIKLPELSFSQNVSKADLSEKLVIWANRASELKENIVQTLAGRALPSVKGGVQDKQIVFMFTGQGSQYPAMFKELYQSNRMFQFYMNTCSNYYEKITGQALTDIIFDADSLLHETRYTQPALFAVGYSLAQMWLAYGVKPSLMLGHSVGEYTAACLAGVFSLEDGMQLITARGELMYALPQHGKMAAIHAAKDVVLRRLQMLPMVEGNYQIDVSIAATNTPDQTVISGSSQEVEKFCRVLQEAGIKSVFLQVSHAFHSPLMEPMLNQFEAIAQKVNFSKPVKQIISNVTGKVIGEEIASWQYWSQHILAEVKFYDSVQAIEHPEQYVFLEIGPGAVLSTMVERICGEKADCVISHLSEQSAANQIEASLFHLYNCGVAIHWKAYYADAGLKRIPVPNYQFSEKHFGLEPVYEDRKVQVNEAQQAGKQAGKQEDAQESERELEGTTSILGGQSYQRTFANKNEVKAYIRKALIQELRVEEDELIDDCNLLLYGLNSIVLTRLMADWKKEWAVPLNAGMFLSQCTINKWSDIMLEQLRLEGSEGTHANEAIVPYRSYVDKRYEGFPLNEVQYAYWVGRNVELDWGGVGCYTSFELDVDELDPIKFERALTALIERHDMLRAIISADGTQQIVRNIELPLTIYRKEQIDDLSAHLERVREQISTQVIPLGQPMFDVRLTEVAEREWRIHFGIDFMIADAWSLYIFWTDLDRLYAGQSLPALEATFRDYVNYKMECKQTRQYERDKQYWLSRVEQFPAAPAIALNLAEGRTTQGRFVRRKQWVDRETWLQFVRSAAEQQLTPSAALLSLYAEVLSAWGAGSHFAIMLTVFSRENVHPEMNQVIGDFTQLSLVEVHRAASTVAVNAATIQSQMQADIEHSSYSAIDFVKELNSWDQSQERMYPVVFTSALGMEQMHDSMVQQAFLDRMGWSVSSTPQVWMDHQVYDEQGGVTLSWDTLDAVFHPGVVDSMFEAYVTLVMRAATDQRFWSETLADLRTDSERQSHEQANHTFIDFLDWNDALLHEQIRHRAVTDADRTAVEYGGTSYSYKQLIARADQVSELLQERGVCNGDKVALQMQKSFEQIAVVLGIVQAGAAYIPLAYDHPLHRTLDIVRVAGVSVLFVDDDVRMDDESVNLVTPAELDGKQGLWNEVQIDPSQLAYVIYTSGSTGMPKGVCIEHRAAMNTIIDVNRRLSVTEQDRMLGLSSLSFDLSVYDIFGMLTAGGVLVLPTESERLDPICWRTLSQQNEVTLWNSVPALMDIYVDYMLGNDQHGQDVGIRHIILSGDWIPLGLFDKIKQALPHAKLMSMGGATEASIWSNYYEVTAVQSDWTSIPYGYPLANQFFYILDEFGRRCPNWVQGKLYIAGKGLAAGYLNEEQLTNKAFIFHPELKQRLYDTGDYGRYMPHGIIEFLGRRDSQIKRNGYRIELGEIQSAFGKCGIAGDAVILPIGDRMDSKKLVVYVRGNPASFNESDLKQRLKSYLPSYFVPDKMIAVEQFPITRNGKIDRAKLLEQYNELTVQVSQVHDGHSIVKGNALATAALEQHPVMQTVREILNVPDLTSADQFGAKGVSSVDMIRLANHLETAYGERPSVGDMLRYGSVSELIYFYNDHDKASISAASNTYNVTSSGSQEQEPHIRSESMADEYEMNELELLIERCLVKKIQLWVEDGRLKFKAPQGAMTADIQLKLKENKASLIGYIQETSERSGIQVGLHSRRTFRQTPIQLAYVMGRSPAYELGNTSAHYYSEFECGSMNPEKLEQAVNQVIAAHEMLRTVVYANGTQQVLLDVPYFEVPVNDIQNKQQLTAIRDEWSHHCYELGKWPMFHVQVSQLSNQSAILHFSFDCLIVDGWSAEMMFREIFSAYAGKPIVQPKFSFREYMNQEESWLREKKYHEEARMYWEERMKQLPPAPELPFKTKLSDIEKPRFRRLKMQLSEEDTRLFSARMKKYQFTPSAVICTAYMKVLSHWSTHPDITLNLTLFNRLPLHKDVPRILGDFTNITLISYLHNESHTFVQELADVHNQLWNAVEYRTHNGLDLLRKLAKGSTGKTIMPIVFTSLLFGESSAGTYEDTLPPDLKEVYAISQTPQVAIDHQAYERNGSMALIWDVVEDAFEDKLIENMFTSYTNLIQLLIAEEDWNNVFAVPLPVSSCTHYTHY